jgi:hypothetical protein
LILSVSFDTGTWAAGAGLRRTIRAPFAAIAVADVMASGRPEPLIASANATAMVE